MSETEYRPCNRCGQCRTAKHHDPCIADLPGVRDACCGHGIESGYVNFVNGLVIRGIWDHLREELTPKQIELWFNRWLDEPISDRERVIIAETIYALQHPKDLNHPQ
jgi:hypothetical protein